MASRAHSLLIVSPSPLADTVHGLQLSAALKAQCDGLKISWIARDLFAPLVRLSTAVDRVYGFERTGGAKGFLRLVREVRQTTFDYVFDLQGLLRTGLLTSRVVGKRKVGRTDARELAGLFYHEKVPLPPAGRRSHELEILLQFCPVLGAKPEWRGPLTFRSGDTFTLKFAEGRGGTKPIVMFPDSRRVERSWTGFKQLTELILRSDRTRKVIWAGGTPVADRGSFQREQFLNLTGNTSLVSLPALIGRADWIISNDNGPMHLAAALGVPTVGIFGPTNPEVSGPYPLTAPNHVIVQAPAGELKLLPAREVFARWQRAQARREKAG